MRDFMHERVLLKNVFNTNKPMQINVVDSLLQDYMNVLPINIIPIIN